MADPIDIGKHRHRHVQKLKSRKAADLRQALGEARETTPSRDTGSKKLLDLYKRSKPPR